MAGHSSVQEHMFGRTSRTPQRSSCSQLSAKSGVGQEGLPDPAHNPRCARPSWPPRPRRSPGCDRPGHQESLGGDAENSRRFARGYGPVGYAIIVEALRPKTETVPPPMCAPHFSKYGGQWVRTVRSPSCSAGYGASSIPVPREIGTHGRAAIEGAEESFHRR